LGHSLGLKIEEGVKFRLGGPDSVARQTDVNTHRQATDAAFAQGENLPITMTDVLIT
jgi:hypothetical protein